MMVSLLSAGHENWRRKRKKKEYSCKKRRKRWMKKKKKKKKGSNIYWAERQPCPAQFTRSGGGGASASP